MIKLLNRHFKTKPSKPLVRIAKPSEIPLARPTISIVEKSVKNFNIPPTLKLTSFR